MRTWCAVLALLAISPVARAQRYEAVPLGDFEQWMVREIQESLIVGGKTQYVYEIAPSDTIRGNVIFDHSNTIWSTSNAYARVSGVTKCNISVTPDDGPSGRCAKLHTHLVYCKVAGLVNLSVLAQGSIYWARTIEPITGMKNPYAFMDWGIPFTKKPKALVLDYRSIIPNSGQIVKATTGRTQYLSGTDPAEILIFLQKRVENPDGSWDVKRVGSGAFHIDKTSNGWVFNFRVPIIYGDASKSPDFKEGMELIESKDRAYYATTSSGKRMPLIESGWSDEAPTHAILHITSGSLGAFIGALDNTLWIDNVRFEY